MVTTAPAPTIAPSPVVTSGTTVTATPSHTLRPMTIGAGVVSPRRSGSTAWFKVVPFTCSRKSFSSIYRSCIVRRQ